MKVYRLENDAGSVQRVAREVGGHWSYDDNPDGSQPMHFLTMERTNRLGAPGALVVRDDIGVVTVIEPDAVKAVAAFLREEAALEEQASAPDGWKD